MKNDEGEEIICIIYDGKNNFPHSVFTRNKYGGTSCHDFDWCEHFEILAHHESGGGGGCPYVHRCSPGDFKIWVKPGTEISNDCGIRKVKVLSRSIRKGRKYTSPWRKSKRVRPRTLRRRGYTVLKNPIQHNGTTNPFVHYYANSQEVGTVYCTVCEVTHPELDYEDPCAHIHYCDTCGGWAGEGAGPDDYPDCKHTGDEDEEEEDEE